MNFRIDHRDELSVLGLGKNAGWPEIQSAYRRMALRLHPDVGSSSKSANSAEEFRRVTDAYETLRRRHLEERLRSRDHLDQIRADATVSVLPFDEIELRIRHSSSPQIRAASALLLGDRRGSRSRKILLVAAGDSDEQVRTAAIESLKKIGTPWDVVKSVAKNTFMRLGGEHTP